MVFDSLVKFFLFVGVYLSKIETKLLSKAASVLIVTILLTISLTVNHSQISQISDRPLKNQVIMSGKSVFYVTKNFSNNAKHVLNLKSFYSISSTFSSEYQSQVGIEEK